MGYGDRIRQARRKKGLTQEALGEAVGFGQTTVQGWEQERNEPELETLRKIAKATDTDPCWLAFGDDLPPSEVSLLRVFRQLNSVGRRGVEVWLQQLLEGQAAAAPPEEGR